MQCQRDFWKSAYWGPVWKLLVVPQKIHLFSATKKNLHFVATASQHVGSMVCRDGFEFCEWSIVVTRDQTLNTLTSNHSRRTHWTSKSSSRDDGAVVIYRRTLNVIHHPVRSKESVSVEESMGEDGSTVRFCPVPQAVSMSLFPSFG